MACLEAWSPIAKEYNPLSCGSIDGTDDYPHDKGILRALNSTYKVNKQVEGDPLCTIFVGRLNPETTEDSLSQIFEDFGKIKRLRLVRDIISGFSKRYAFIEYKSGSSARKAVSRADKMRVDDREILVDMECERELKGWIPRRLGGGFGGKKESGQLRFGGKDRPFRKPIVFNRPLQADSRQHAEEHQRERRPSSPQSHVADDNSTRYHSTDDFHSGDKYDRSDRGYNRYKHYKDKDRDSRYTRNSRLERESEYRKDKHSRRRETSADRTSEHKYKSRKSHHRSRSRSMSREHKSKKKKSRRD